MNTFFTSVFFLLLLFSYSKSIAEETLDSKIEFGKNLMMMRDYVKAIKKFDEVLAIDKKHPDALFNKSLCNYSLFEYKLALDDLNILAGIIPKVADVYNLRGLAKMGLKDTSNALNDFNKAIILDNKFPQAYLNRGKALIFLSRNVEALKDLVKAISLDSNVADMYYTKARAEHNLGLYRQAVDDFTTAMKNSYINTDIFYRRGNSFFKDKDYQNAISDYTQVIFWEPLNPLAYNNRAFVYDILGDSAYAKQDRKMIEDIEYGLTLNPEDAKLKLFSNKDSNFTIMLPDDFILSDNSNSDSVFCTFYPKDETLEMHRIGITLKILPFYSKKIGSTEPAEIIEHFRTQQDSLGKGFWRFELSERVNKPYKNYPTLLDKILVQKDLKGVAYLIWNYGIAFGEHLIVMNFTIPLPLYSYYSEVYLKSLESFVIRKI
jgi:tetratricopeptide (TPR) repeat protein